MEIRFLSDPFYQPGGAVQPKNGPTDPNMAYQKENALATKADSITPLDEKP